MKLDRLIQILLPHDEKFYAFFEESANNLIRATDLLPVLLDADPSKRAAIVEELHAVEHQGDAVTHNIFNELNATFVTPFDREDIHTLASALDDVLDNIDGTASRIHLYKIDHFPPAVKTLVEILRKSVRELQTGVALLRDFRKSAELQKVLERVNEYENEADDVFEAGIAELFEKTDDPIFIIKMKEVYVGLETATDMCEDAANVMESLLIKHA